MKFSESWLREWVDPPVSTTELAEQLTMAGLEVEAIEPVAPPFEGIVVGEVLEVQSHPRADRLRVCKVGVGEGKVLPIVCGAPNVAEGMRAPTALVGAVLPGGMKIKKARLRGEPSEGMLCSAVELGMAEQADGLWALPPELATGQDLRAALQLDDVTIELGLTPDRGDCLGIAGVAREVGVRNRCEVRAAPVEPVTSQSNEKLDVRIDAPADCAVYVGRVVRGIDPRAHTPLWMQERLRRSGLRSLGPVVDVTNYVLLELGQPMHGFDLDRLAGGIVVRHATKGEKLTLLDGQEVELDADALVIADHEKALALAGIMGGQDSAVSDQTRSVFLESAFFHPTTISGRARAYGLHTDSSHRFERGVAPDLQRIAMERATRLLLDITGGEPGPVVECRMQDHLPTRTPIQLRATRIRRVLGLEVSREEVADILQRLGMQVEATEAGWQVVAPDYRFDITLEVDLIEEVGRIVGYDRLPTSRSRIPMAIQPQPEAVVTPDSMRAVLVGRGYQEAITYSFVDPDLQQQLDPDHDPVSLANPIASDMAVMRTSLWPGLVETLRYNCNRQQNRIRLFEYGMRFISQDNDIKQDNVLSGVVSGNVEPEQWGEASREADFFAVKADVEALLDLGGAGESYRFVAARHPTLHPGQSARILRGDQEAGWLGLLDPGLEQVLDLQSPAVLFELVIEQLSGGAIPGFRALSRYPSIRRDIAITVDESVTAQAVRACATEAASEVLQDILVFDVYTGKGIDSGRKSLALGLILQDSLRTLTDKDVDRIQTGILRALEEGLGASLRE